MLILINTRFGFSQISIRFNFTTILAQLHYHVMHEDGMLLLPYP